MNCQPGNPAVIVKGRDANIGKMVRVVEAYGEVDYSNMGYGLLPCWTVVSMGGFLDTVGGPSMEGFIPDMALRPMMGVSPEQAAAAKARFNEALSELAEIARDVEERETREGMDVKKALLKAFCRLSDRTEDIRTRQRMQSTGAIGKGFPIPEGIPTDAVELERAELLMKLYARMMKKIEDSGDLLLDAIAENSEEEPDPDEANTAVITERDDLLSSANGLVTNNCYFVSQKADLALADPAWQLCELSSWAEMDVVRNGYLPVRPGFYTLSDFFGKYWLLTGMEIVTTIEVARYLKSGGCRAVNEGPFDTLADAQYAFDVIWESPGAD